MNAAFIQQEDLKSLANRRTLMLRSFVSLVPVFVAALAWFVQPVLGSSVELVDDDRVARADARFGDESGVRTLRDRVVPRFGEDRQLQAEVAGNSPDNDVAGRSSALHQSMLRFTGGEDDDVETVGEAFNFSATLSGNANVRESTLFEDPLVEGATSGVSRFDVRIGSDDLLRVRASGTGRAQNGARIAFRGFGEEDFDFTLEPTFGRDTDSFNANALLPPGNYRIFAEVVTAAGLSSRFSDFDDGVSTLDLSVSGETVELSDVIGAPSPAALGPGLALLGALFLRRPRRRKADATG